MTAIVNDGPKGTREPDRQTYGDWIIKYDPPPIPIRTADWQFYHKDYDGAPIHSEGPPADNRSGFGPTAEDCRRQIDEYEDDEDAEPGPPLDPDWAKETAHDYHMAEEAQEQEMMEEEGPND